MGGGDFTFAHLADAHVGAWPRDPAVRTALRDGVLRALAVVEERDCAFLLISGDLFHTPVPEPSEVAPVAAALRRLVAQGRRVYVIYGSHDYVAHRTSWLDVLAETGIFLKAAPEPVHEEGDRFSLRYHIDEPTGAIIAGLSGRSHGLDAGSFRAMDSEAFRSEKGFHIFQFHAAVREYLPEKLRAHVLGISRADLPGGCAYYAGGHIHATYTGEGPDGGLLVNPGAVFGTSVTDLENGALDRTRQGLAVVRVHDGSPELEFVRTTPTDRVKVLRIDVAGRTPEAARAMLEEEVRREASPGALLFPKVVGTLAGGGSRSLGLGEAAAKAEDSGASAVHWDLAELESSEADGSSADRPEAELEREALERIAAAAPPELELLRGPGGEARLRELLRELGTTRGEGEAKLDYEAARVEGALRILEVRGRSGRFGPR